MRMFHVKPDKGMVLNHVVYTYTHRDFRGTIHPRQFTGANSEIANQTFVGSFIACQHDTDKWWESLFIPLDANGSMGISYTTWGRKGGVKGSSQAKIVSETEWYSTVTSKIGGGDYKVLAYMGRELGLSHSATTLYSVIPDSVRTPPFGMDRATSQQLVDQISLSAVHKHLVDFISRNEMIRDFIDKAAVNGHQIGKDIAQMDVGTPATRVWVQQIGDGIAANLGILPSSPILPTEPAVDRAALYDSAWGAFG